MTLEMREVETFLAVADQLHFGRAAGQLRFTPSRVSQIIRQLERRVGGPLFERSSRRVALTPLGRQLEARWRPAYTQLQTALDEVRLATTGPVVSRLRIGYPATLLPGTLERITDFYAANRPAERLLWVQDQLVDMYRWRPGVDLGMDGVLGWMPEGAAPPGDYLRFSRPIQRRAPVVAVSPDHPLAGRSEVDIEELADHPLLQPGAVLDAGIEWVPPRTPGGRPLNRILRPAQHLESLFAPVLEEGLGHLTLTGLDQTPAWNLVRGHAVLVPVTGLVPFTLCAAWPTLASSAAAVAEFVEVAIQAGQTEGWL